MNILICFIECFVNNLFIYLSKANMSDEEKEYSYEYQYKSECQYNACAAGIMSSSRNFTDFAVMINKPSSSNAPKWRYYSKGLNIESK